MGRPGQSAALLRRYRPDYVRSIEVPRKSQFETPSPDARVSRSSA